MRQNVQKIKKPLIINYKRLWQLKKLENSLLKLENEKVLKELELYRKNKGGQSSINGLQYEIKIFTILQKTTINNKPFNTQSLDELGGSTKDNDLSCNYNSENIGIEVKSTQKVGRGGVC